MSNTSKNSRYEGNWYYCWLVERRDRPHPEWWNGDFWVREAKDALWFARHCDAENIVYAYTHWGKPKDVVICEHGFMLEQPTNG